MENKLTYSFDDEPIIKFCYQLNGKKMEVHFNRYYSLNENMYVENRCIWILENWDEAKIMVGDDKKLYDLNKYIGIFSLILYMKFNENEELEMLVNTLDNRYITLFFKRPSFILKEIN